MHKFFSYSQYYGMLPLESGMLGNGPVPFGKGATEKGYCSTSLVPYFIREEGNGKGP
jgi:hypothetical protein